MKSINISESRICAGINWQISFRINERDVDQPIVRDKGDCRKKSEKRENMLDYIIYSWLRRCDTLKSNQSYNLPRLPSVIIRLLGRESSRSLTYRFLPDLTPVFYSLSYSRAFTSHTALRAKHSRISSIDVAFSEGSVLRPPTKDRASSGQGSDALHIVLSFVWCRKTSFNERKSHLIRMYSTDISN